MAQFRKKPVIVEAERFDASFVDRRRHRNEKNEVVEPKPLPDGVRFTLEGHGGRPELYGKFSIRTLEGDMIVSVGDWIVTGVKGEKYPVKPDIFEATYEEVKE